MRHTERSQAIQVLSKLLKDNLSLAHLLHDEHSPLVKKLCFGVCRHYFQLDAIASTLLKSRPKVMEVWVSILIGLYQLRFLNIPDYAVVKETVATLAALKKPWAKALVNAILRNYCRKEQELNEKLHNNPVYQYNHPQWLIKKLKTDWPKDWPVIMQANNTHPPMSLRINRQKTTQTTYLKQLQDKNIKAQAHPLSVAGFILDKPCDVFDLPGFATGDVSVQDIAAQLAAYLLDLKAGQRVLDACCAPGGKTCHIAEEEPALTSLVALDIDEKRLNKVSDNLKRLKLCASVIQGDASKPESWWDGQLFDRILLDAPCSATGVIRRHPDIKLLRSPAEIAAISKRQHALLHALWPLLAPGGVMVYATCSILPEENEQQIARFIAQTKDCTISSQKRPFGRMTGHGWQILPGEDNMDGFFYSLLIKT